MAVRSILRAMAIASLPLWAGVAQAGTVVDFNSLGDPLYQPVSVGLAGTEAQSFRAAGSGPIQSLTLDLNCNGKSGEPACASTGTYANGHLVKTAVVNSTTLNLNSVNGITVGSYIKGVGIKDGAVYVTAVSGKTITLSKAVTIAAEGVSFLHEGSFTVSLVTNSNPAAIPGTSKTTTDTPASGVVLASFTVYDAALRALFPTIQYSTLPTQFTVDSPFGSVLLAGGKTYWIDLQNGSADDPTPTSVGWDLMRGNGGVGVANNYNYTGPRTSFSCLDGAVLPAAGCARIGEVGAVYGMEVISNAAAVPEPAAWALMLVGFAGLGAAARRRTRQLAPARA